MLKEITLKRWDNDQVIFSHTCEDNSISKTLELAIYKRTDLSYINLQGEWLHGCNLSRAFLPNANLRFANLAEVILSSANLTNANLKHSCLDITDFSNAILTNTKFTSDSFEDTMFIANIIDGMTLDGVHVNKIRSINIIHDSVWMLHKFVNSTKKYLQLRISY